MKNIICIIPARGGSKRVPRKNVRRFLGRPIIEYSIKAAISSMLFSRIIVSTDDDEIRDFAIKAGAEVPFKRSVENSSDFASTASVLLEVVDQLELMNEKIEYLCCLYPTAPFVTSEILNQSYVKLINSGSDALVPIVKFDFPVQRSLIVKSDRLEMMFPEFLNSRSQDLEPVYHDCGQFYFIKNETLKNEKKLYTKNCTFIQINELLVQDIDNESDWQIAELKFSLTRKNSGA